MHFDTKSYLKNTSNHTAKHAFQLVPINCNLLSQSFPIPVPFTVKIAFFAGFQTILSCSYVLTS
jgi:hypothetical protein